jgi:hypothetical protein
VMQVKGGKEVTLTPGRTFYEGPNDVHVVGRNASSIKPAKFLVFLVSEPLSRWSRYMSAPIPPAKRRTVYLSAAPFDR